MNTVELEMGLLLRQKLMAAAKPYEAFEDTVLRILSAGADAVSAANVRTLKRSSKRWPEPTEANMEERRRTMYQEFGYSDEEYEDLILSDDFEDEDDDPAEWKHERDFKYPVARRAVMALLYGKKTGSKFKLRPMIYKACPTIGKLPHTVYSNLEKSLLESRHFMRHVRFSKGTKGYDLIVNKVT